MSAPLYGLVLTGGHSRRMQRDKALLDYGGQPQLERALALLGPLVARSFVSVRADQRGEALRARHECIVDRIAGLGPLGGIHAALHAASEAAWLVLACDLPLLDAPTLQRLIAARTPQRIATAYRSSHDGQPEPLCAIWEPAALPAVERWIAADKRCPRALLAASDVTLLELDSRAALDNINTPDELAAVMSQIGGSPAAHRGSAVAPRALRVRYFALLRDQAGRAEEEVTTCAATPHELYAELRERRGLSLAPQLLRVAVNEQFADWRQSLQAGDRVAFLPPVAGG